MNSIQLGLKAEDFIWGTGIEDTFVPQTKPGHRALDEYELMGHYEHWREDLALAREVGVRAIRWGVPWYRVEPAQGEFDWSWTDQVIPYLVEELGITLITDLMHYGCPFWLEREFDNPEYPRAVASYAAAFARRYKSLVRWYTPLNEPLINALWCGKRGVWPPYLHGDRGYVRLTLQLARGIIETVQALKAIDPNAIMVHVEATGLSRTARKDLQALATHHQHRGYLTYDLITGRVTPDHLLYKWLLKHGATRDELTGIARRKISLDVIGMNFYPQWSTQHIFRNRLGRISYRTTEREGQGFAELIHDYYYQRYRVPIIVTETSARGRHRLRSEWLAASLLAIKNLRAKGVPVLGYTWFPLFTMIHWRYRTGRKSLRDYRVELGLYVLDGEDGAPRWRRTPLLEEYQHYIQNPRESVGELRRNAGRNKR